MSLLFSTGSCLRHSLRLNALRIQSWISLLVAGHGPDYFLTCPEEWIDGETVSLICTVKRAVVDNAFCCTTGLYHWTSFTPFCAASINSTKFCNKKGCTVGLKEHCERCHGRLHEAGNHTTSAYLFFFQFRVKSGLHDGNWSCGSATLYNLIDGDGNTLTTACGERLHTISKNSCTNIVIVQRILGVEKTSFLLAVVSAFFVTVATAICITKHCIIKRELLKSRPQKATSEPTPGQETQQVSPVETPPPPDDTSGQTPVKEEPPLLSPPTDFPVQVESSV